MSMERRVLIAVVLSFGLLLLWQFLFPAPKPPEQIPLPAESVPVAASPAPSPPAVSEQASTPGAASGPVGAQEAEEIRVETDLLEVTLTNKGGRVTSWRLRAYPSPDGKPLELLPEFAQREGTFPLALELDDPERTRLVNDALFRVERVQGTGAEGDSASRGVRFTWADGQGLEVMKSIVFRDGTYLVDLQVTVTDRGRPVPAWICWGPGFAADDGDPRGSFHYHGQAVFSDSGRVQRWDRKKVEAEQRHETSRLLWAGLEEQYFAALVLPETAKSEIRIRPVAIPGVSGDEKKPESELVVAAPVSPTGTRLYVGPKKYTLLRDLDGDRRLESVVWFSNYDLVTWLAKWLFLALVWIHDQLLPNYGAAVILLTIALRLVLFPLNQYSMVSMRKMQTQMQRIQPKINAVRAKYKKKDADSRAKMNQELMALYQKEGVNPMGGMSGCLPMLAQFPILIAFYDMLIAAVELRGAPFFGWIRDLTLKDPYYVTPLLMGATMFLQQKMSTPKTLDPQQAQQQKIMMMMPVIFTVMFLNLPSGLVLYWFVNNLLGIAQQWLVNRHIGRLDAASAQKA